MNKNIADIPNPQQQDMIQFVNNKIMCKTHRNQQAKSICMDCKTFCCMVDNCGQPHIYHSIENLDYLVNSQIMPVLNSLKEVNANLGTNKTKHMSYVHNFKNNLKSFAIAEKKKIDEEYRQIMHSLQTIYNSYMDDINEFIETLNQKFDSLQEKVSGVYSRTSTDGSNNESTVSDINNLVNSLLIKSNNNNEVFISLMAKDSKSLNQKLKAIHTQLTKFDFDKEIAELKTFAEREYPKIDKNEYFQNMNKKFKNEATAFIESKKKKEERKSISKLKKMVCMRQSVSPMKDNLEIDLDIFVRYLFDEINKVRKNPSEALKFLDEYVDILNNNDESIYNVNPGQSVLNETISTVSLNLNSKLTFVYEYINSLVSSKVSLHAFEWDNDLSNSAEDYLKLTQGKIEKEFATYIAHMKEIIVTNYYSEYSNINSLTYTGSPQINKIIMNILLNEAYWDNSIKQNILFHPNFNVTGICGVSGPGYNKVILIINLSYLSK